MGYVIVILAAYLMGSSSMAFYLSRLKKVDARQAGSGNLGASNVTVRFPLMSSSLNINLLKWIIDPN